MKVDVPPVLKFCPTKRESDGGTRHVLFHPNVVLPMSKYFAAKMLSETSKSAAEEPAFIEMMERENRLWAEDIYSYQI